MYNPVFTKMCQRGPKKLADSKMLTRIFGKLQAFPLRVSQNLIENRGIKIDN